MAPRTRHAFVLKRILISVLLGMLLAALTSEVAYRWLRRENREPQRVQLIIPPGTAQKVAQGAAPPGIPNDMTFVLGDTLVVVNQDDVDHRLGPLWIPAGTSASLNLGREQDYVLECSFLIFLINFFWSLKHGEKADNNLWNSRSPEWQVPSPMPLHNYEREFEVVGEPYDYGLPGSKYVQFSKRK